MPVYCSGYGSFTLSANLDPSLSAWHLSVQTMAPILQIKKKMSYILNLYGRWPLSGLMRTMAMLFVWSRRTPFPRCYQHGLKKLLYLEVRIQWHYWNRRSLSRLGHSHLLHLRTVAFPTDPVTTR